jgi:hypothetical protein
LITTRRSRSPRPRACTASLSRSATAWPRPIREHLPFLGRLRVLPRRRSPRISARVSGPPLALIAARMTWATKDRARGLARAPRSRMRPGLGRKSKASSWLMLGRLRRPSTRSRLDHDTSHYSDEKLALFGVTRRARVLNTSYARCKNQRADNRLGLRRRAQTPVCFNLALPGCPSFLRQRSLRL